jgi:hypothetical protein
MLVVIIVLGLILLGCSSQATPVASKPPIGPATVVAPVESMQPTVEPVRPQRGPTEKDFEIVSYRVVDEPPGTRIIGEIRNNGRFAAGVELQAVATDARGALIDEVRFWPAGTNNIEAGQTLRFAASGARAGSRGVVVRPISTRVWYDAPSVIQRALQATDPSQAPG